MVGNGVTDELAWGGSQTIDLPIDEVVKSPISYYTSCFKKYLIEKAWHLETEENNKLLSIT